MNTKDDDELIQFLNGFNYTNPTADMFLNDDGLPTDPFLEALKSDGNVFENESSQKLLTSRHQSLKDSVSGNHHRSLLYNSKKGFVDVQSDDDGSSASEDSFVFENPKNDANYKRFKTSQKSHTTNKHIHDERTAFEESDHKTKRKKVKAASSNKRTKPKVTAPPSVHIADKPTTRVTAAAQLADETNFPKEHLFDTTEMEVEAEARVKGLRLRLSGQLNTIRSLETQLAESGELLGARNKQLAQAHARLKALEPVAAAASKATTPLGKESAGRVRAAEETAERFKKQADQLQSRLLEEQGRRQRAEEKCRVLKDYAEKSKNRCLSLESMTAEGKGAVAELTQRGEKYRKAYKELAAETTAQKGAVVEREAEVAAQRQRVERVESALRNCQMELEHCREELRGVRLEHKTALANARQLEVQLEIVREKDATQKAERRLRQIESDRDDRRQSDRLAAAPSRIRGAAGRGDGFGHVQLRPYGSTAMASNERSGYLSSDSMDAMVVRESVRHVQNQQQRSAAFLHQPPMPPQFSTHQSHEWQRHSASHEEETADFNLQMVAAERALDQEVMRSNAEQRDVRSPLIPEEKAPPEKRPHYILARDPSPARATTSMSNTVAFIRNRVDAGETRAVSRGGERGETAQQSRPPTVPRPSPLSLSESHTQSFDLDIRHQEVVAVDKSPDSESSSPLSSRDSDSRLQKLYAKVTAKSGGSGGSVSSKQ